MAKKRLMTAALLLAFALAATGCGSKPGRIGRDEDVASDSGAALPRGSSSHTIKTPKGERTYRTYVPANLDTSSPAPLVVMLHGGFGSAQQAEASYGWDAKAEAEGFVVVYPNGAGKAWNAGSCCGNPARDAVDDVGFITQTVAVVEQHISIDPRRVFVTGMSNGAMMAERLACETKLFAAAASVAGAQMVPCSDPAPVSMLHIHGTADRNVPMDGSPGNGRGHVPAHPTTVATIEAWRRLLGCGTPETVTDGKVTRSTSACPSGRAVELITVAGAGHQWPGSKKSRPALAKALGIDQPSDALDATATIWDFFAAHPAPA